MKERFDIIASSLSSYFGVGFLTPKEQLMIDLGIEERYVDDESQARMDLGNYMEDACLNYFEHALKIIITDRNSEYGYACNGLLKCKRDGNTVIDGVETGVENKYSNSSSKDFVDDMGYYIQCQAYMMAWNLDQWLLCGMQNGKPLYKIIKKDEEVQKDIEEIVATVSGILSGLLSVDDYPYHIVEKYSKKNELAIIDEENLEEYDKNLIQSIVLLKDKEKAIKEKLEELQKYAKENYADCKYITKDYTFSVSTMDGRASFDKHTFSIENPLVDIERYYKKGEAIRTIRITKKKKA